MMGTNDVADGCGRHSSSSSSERPYRFKTSGNDSANGSHAARQRLTPASPELGWQGKYMFLKLHVLVPSQNSGGDLISLILLIRVQMSTKSPLGQMASKSCFTSSLWGDTVDQGSASLGPKNLSTCPVRD